MIHNTNPNQYAGVASFSLAILGDNTSFNTLPKRDTVNVSPNGNDIEFLLNHFTIIAVWHILILSPPTPNTILPIIITIIDFI